jgi:uncharacterized protein
MRIFAIADPHLSRAAPKPMDIFGGNWTGHPEAFFEGWRSVGITEHDLVLIPGDISWAMSLEGALIDLLEIAALPGIKVISRGNHDYWWSAIGKLRQALPPQMYALQNDALELNGAILCGSRGWSCPDSEDFSLEDEKIYKREVERLRMSLQAAKKLKGARDLKTIVMLHYPPTASSGRPTGFTALLEEFRPDALVYGHLHGVNPERLRKHWEGIPLHFVAADALRFKPMLLPFE